MDAWQVWLDHGSYGATLISCRHDSDTRPVETSVNEQRPTGGNRLEIAGPSAIWRALGLEYRGLEAKQAQIPQQLGHALVIERGLGRAYAELDLPSNSDLAFGAGLAET